jgi:hypothetical protein
VLLNPLISNFVGQAITEYFELSPPQGASNNVSKAENDLRPMNVSDQRLQELVGRKST